jgi:DNA modification methylase
MTEWAKEHWNEIFPVYSDTELFEDMGNFVFGKSKLFKLLSMYFLEIRYRCSRAGAKHAPMDVLEDQVLLDEAKEFMLSHPRVFKRGWHPEDLKRYFAIGGNRASSVANFPAPEAKRLMKKFTPPGGWVHDPSAGFGSRMSAALLSGFRYTATDPNKELYPILRACYDKIVQSGFAPVGSEFGVYCQGSEVFIPELEGKIDFAFTSPPYFDLEKYSVDEGASTKNYSNYRLWGLEYVVPTCINIKRYLKQGGYVGINIKSMDGKPLYEDWFKIFEKLKMKFVEEEQIKIGLRVYNINKGSTVEELMENWYKTSNTEKVMIFQKV